MSASDWSVYLLECADGSLYTGIARDLTERVARHNDGRASKYTRSRLPVKLVYAEEAADRAAASRREHAIKRLSAAEKRQTDQRSANQMTRNHDEFLRAFEQCTLPPEEWTHPAHIRMAWLYLTALPFADACEKIRAGIRRYNGEVLHVPHKYHDTVTIAYAHLIANRLADDETWPQFEKRNEDLFDPASNSLLDYYSPETLASDAARLAFVPPDRRKLPTIG